MKKNEENSKSSRKFKNIRTKLNDDLKSCPKCAKVIAKNAKKCSCGYSFESKSNGLLISLIICIIVMALLLLLVYFDVAIIKDNIKIIIYVLGGIGIFSVLYRSLFYGENEKISYSAEEEIAKKTLTNFKKASIVIAIMGVMLLIFLGLYLLLSYLGIW